MKMTEKINKKSWILGLALLAAAGCSDDDPVTPPPSETGKYLVAAVSGTATYFLTADDLEATNTISPAGNNGLEYSNTFTQYINNENASGLFAVKYGQGGAHIAAGFTIGANGRAQQVGTDIELPSGFNTAGSVGQYVITARHQQTLTDGSTGVVVNFINMANNNQLVSKTRPTTNFPGFEDTELVFRGISDAGNGNFFVGLDATTTTDEVNVAKLDADLNVITMYNDSRLSITGGQRGSVRYSHIATLDNGDTYVFSGPPGNSETTKKGGALVIKNGATDFDASYYFNIEDKASGYRFKRVYHITGDYFLLEFFSEQGQTSSNDSKHFGVVKVTTQEFKWVTGLPDKSEITSDTGWSFVHNGKVYIGISTATAGSAVYSIDPVTAVGKKGLVVEDVESIQGMTFITD